MTLLTKLNLYRWIISQQVSKILNVSMSTRILHHSQQMKMVAISKNDLAVTLTSAHSLHNLHHHKSFEISTYCTFPDTASPS